MEEIKSEEITIEIMQKYEHIVISVEIDALKSWSKSIAIKLAEN